MGCHDNSLAQTNYFMIHVAFLFIFLKKLSVFKMHGISLVSNTALFPSPTNQSLRIGCKSQVHILEIWKKGSQKIEYGLEEPYIYFFITRLLACYLVFGISV